MNAEMSRQPCAQQTGDESDNPLWSDAQSGLERGQLQDLLKIDGENEHFTTVPQAEQQHEGAGVAQSVDVQQGRLHERVGPTVFVRREGRARQGGQSQRSQYADGVDTGGGSLGDSEDQGAHRQGDQERAGQVQVPPGTRRSRLPQDMGSEQ